MPAWLNPTPPSLAGLTASSSQPSQCPAGTAPASRPQSSHPKCLQIVTSHSVLFPLSSRPTHFSSLLLLFLSLQLLTLILISLRKWKLSENTYYWLLQPNLQNPLYWFPPLLLGNPQFLLTSKDLTRLEVSSPAPLTFSLLHSSHWPINKQ